jgi:hypothetical protein
MSTPFVVRDTLALAEELGLRVALLPEWYDVDTAAELSRLRTELTEAPAAVAPRTRLFLSAVRCQLSDNNGQRTMDNRRS